LIFWGAAQPNSRQTNTPPVGPLLDASKDLGHEKDKTKSIPVQSLADHPSPSPSSPCLIHILSPIVCQRAARSTAPECSSRLTVLRLLLKLLLRASLVRQPLVSGPCSSIEAPCPLLTRTLHHTFSQTFVSWTFQSDVFGGFFSPCLEKVAFSIFHRRQSIARKPPSRKRFRPSHEHMISCAPQAPRTLANPGRRGKGVVHDGGDNTTAGPQAVHVQVHVG
jgi:hypothetical protein